MQKIKGAVLFSCAFGAKHTLANGMMFKYGESGVGFGQAFLPPSFPLVVFALGGVLRACAAVNMQPSTSGARTLAVCPGQHE